MNENPTTETSYTKGPWSRTRSGNGDWFKSPHSEFGPDYPIPSSEANLNLMAAAPALLAALEYLLETGERHALHEEAKAQARAAIARAKGA